MDVQHARTRLSPIAQRVVSAARLAALDCLAGSVVLPVFARSDSP
jgi:hypothetical protein